MPDDKPQLTDEQIKEIAARRAEALKRVQEMHRQTNTGHATDKGGKAVKAPPPKGRPYRHQGR